MDEIGNKWVHYFAAKFEGRTNYRGGRYHTGLYTVSAHVPMGANVGATPDGRPRQGAARRRRHVGRLRPRSPRADGAARRPWPGWTRYLGSNGTLLNMKFLPRLFKSEEGAKAFSSMLRGFVQAAASTTSSSTW